jgi:hypothetical protein
MASPFRTTETLREAVLITICGRVSGHLYHDVDGALAGDFPGQQVDSVFDSVRWSRTSSTDNAGLK